MLTDKQIKALSDKIVALIPSDPNEALAVLALNYAAVVCATRCDDESGIEAIRRALRQMREQGVGENSH